MKSLGSVAPNFADQAVLLFVRAAKYLNVKCQIAIVEERCTEWNSVKTAELISESARKSSKGAASERVAWSRGQILKGCACIRFDCLASGSWVILVARRRLDSAS